MYRYTHTHIYIYTHVYTYIEYVWESVDWLLDFLSLRHISRTKVSQNRLVRSRCFTIARFDFWWDLVGQLCVSGLKQLIPKKVKKNQKVPLKSALMVGWFGGYHLLQGFLTFSYGCGGPFSHHFLTEQSLQHCLEKQKQLCCVFMKLDQVGLTEWNNFWDLFLFWRILNYLEVVNQLGSSNITNQESESIFCP